MKGRIRFTDAGKVYEIDGREVTEEVFYEAFPPVAEFAAEALCAAPPHKSESLACHPKDVEAFREDAKMRGVPTEFRRDGRPIMTSRAHQKKYLKAYGYHNNDGGYGD